MAFTSFDPKKAMDINTLIECVKELEMCEYLNI